MENILKDAQRIYDEMVSNRRYLHANPEIGSNLPQTTAFVMQKLTELGLAPKEIVQSGVVATVGTGGKTILIRADMDALPMKENTQLPFKSTNEYGHLCGHDMHTAILLGVAKLLKERESELQGTVKLMFQPAEEIAQGAKAMVEAGVLENPKVDAAIALHVWTDLLPGQIGFKKGVASSALYGFMAEIQGKGGHGSTPHLAIDPLPIVNTIAMMLNQLVGKETDPFETTVLTIGKCGGGNVANVIPDTAVIEGTVRCFNEEIRTHLSARIPEIINDITTLMRGTCTIKEGVNYSVINDEGLCDALIPYIEEIIGKDNLGIFNIPLSGSEDFSFLSRHVPTMLMFAGAGHKGNQYFLHNPNMVLDESAMLYGAAVLANCAINWLKSN